MNPAQPGPVELPVLWSLLLIAAALWNFVIWPRFWRRVAADPRSRDDAGRATRFFKVHAGLITVSLAFAILVGTLGMIGLATRG